MSPLNREMQDRSLAHFLPSTLLVAFFLLLAFLFGCFKQMDADIWWHLKTGELILERHQLPQTDWYTFTVSDRAWIDLHWLFQIAAARIYAIGGMELLTATSATLGAVAVGIQLLARRPGWSVPVAIASWYPFLFLVAGRLYVRPEVVTLVILSCYLTILYHADRRPLWLIALVPLQILWVNVQGLFILGLLVTGMYWLDGIWRRAWRQPNAQIWCRSILLVALVSACLLNPYGLRGVLFPIELFRKMSVDAPFYSKRISELQSLDQFIAAAGYFQFYVLLQFALLGFATVSFLLVWWQGRFDLFRFLTFAVFAWLGTQATRNSGQFALAAGAVTAWNFGEWFAMRRDKRSSRLNLDSTPKSNHAAEANQQAIKEGQQSYLVSPVVAHLALLLILSLTAWMVASGNFYAAAGEGRLFGLGEHPLWHGHDAARFAAQPGMPGRMLAFHLGQAAVFEFHKRDDQRTFCDPRLEVVTRELLEEYHAIEEAIERDRAGWEEWLNGRGVPMIMVDMSASNYHAMAATLLSSTQWRCVYFDAVAAIFLHRDASSAIPAVNFAKQLFATEDPRFIHATDKSPASRSTADDPDPRLYEAKALHGIGVNTLNRRVFDLQLFRSMLLLAAKHASVAQCPRQKPHELDRLRGQIYRALTPLTGRELRAEDMTNFSWDISAMLDLARSRYFLGLARQEKADDLSTLVQLYELAKLQMDQRTHSELRNLLLHFRPRTPTQRRLLGAMGESLRSEQALTKPDPMPDQMDLRDFNEVHRVMLRMLENARPDLAMALLLSCRQAAGPLPWPLADTLSSLSMFLGSPGTGLEPDQIAGEVDAAVLTARRGTAQLVMGHLGLSVDAYRAALELDPSNLEANFGLARAYLELGDGMKTYEACQNSLGLANINSGMRHNLEWMSELAQPFGSAQQ